MSNNSLVVEMESHLAFLNKSLDGANFSKQVSEQKASECKSVIDDLEINLHNLRKNSVIVSMEHYGKIKQSISLVKKIMKDSEKTVSESEALIKSLKKQIAAQEDRVRTLKEHFNRDNVLPFRLKNG